MDEIFDSLLECMTSVQKLKYLDGASKKIIVLNKMKDKFELDQEWLVVIEGLIHAVLALSKNPSVLKLFKKTKKYCFPKK